MRALSVQQPFAEALVAGVKRVENRKGPFPSTVPLPAWVAIHASAEPFPSDDACHAALGRLGFETWVAGRRATRSLLPLGRIVGAVRFVVSSGVLEHLDDPWARGPWCWVADRAVRVYEGPEIKGKLGLWHLPPSVAEGVEAAIIEQYGGFAE